MLNLHRPNLWLILAGILILLVITPMMTITMNKSLAKAICKQTKLFVTLAAVQPPLLPGVEHSNAQDPICMLVTCVKSGERKCNSVTQKRCKAGRTSQPKSGREPKIKSEREQLNYENRGRTATGSNPSKMETRKHVRKEDGISYCYLTQLEKYTWSNALNLCRHLGMDLLALETAEEWDYIYRMHIEDSSGDYWTSGFTTNITTVDSWTWRSTCESFTFPPSFAQWDTSGDGNLPFPGNVTGTPQCMGLTIKGEKPDSKWFHDDCTVLYRAICEIRTDECRGIFEHAATRNLQPDFESTIKIAGVSGDKNRARNSSALSCYSISLRNNDSRTWKEASNACGADGLGQLTSLFSTTERDHLNTLITNERTPVASADLQETEQFWLGGIFLRPPFHFIWKTTCLPMEWQEWKMTPTMAEIGRGQRCLLYQFVANNVTTSGIRVGYCHQKRRYICIKLTSDCTLDTLPASP